MSVNWKMFVNWNDIEDYNQFQLGALPIFYIISIYLVFHFQIRYSLIPKVGIFKDVIIIKINLTEIINFLYFLSKHINTF